jgi:hypothetical protein
MFMNCKNRLYYKICQFIALFLNSINIAKHFQSLKCHHHLFSKFWCILRPLHNSTLRHSDVEALLLIEESRKIYCDWRSMHKYRNCQKFLFSRRHKEVHRPLVAIQVYHYYLTGSRRELLAPS